MRINSIRLVIITFYLISCISLYSFQEVELYDLTSKNKIETKIEFLFEEKNTLREINDKQQNFKKLSQLSQSILLYYKDFLLAIREEDQGMPKTRKLLLDSDQKEMIFLDQPLERRVLYSDYMEDSTPRFLFELDKNLYSLILHSNSGDHLTLPVSFKIQDGKPYIVVANEEAYVKVRSKISNILYSYKSFEKLNCITIKREKHFINSKLFYILSITIIIIITIVIIIIFRNKLNFNQ